MKETAPCKIPKIIHYCWFGGNPLPEMARKCIESWKKYCPDYEIIEWNENNFDVNYCQYSSEAYKTGKWAFVSDVARLYALVNVGGVYMDTDVEVTKPIDEYLVNEAFSGFESYDKIPTGIMAAMKGHPMFAEMLSDYAGKSFFLPDGLPNLETNVTKITALCVAHGLKLNNTMQTVNGFTLYPNDVFCPKNAETGIMTITENTHTIHHFDGSWLSEEEKDFAAKKIRYRKVLPKKPADYAARFFAALHFRGIRGAFGDLFVWMKRSENGKV